MSRPLLAFLTLAFALAAVGGCTTYSVNPGWHGGGGWGYGGGGWGHTNVFVANNHYNYYHPGRW